MNGVYSLIQYCPDPARAEAVNVGVVVLAPGHAAAVRVEDSIRRVRHAFPDRCPPLAWFRMALQGLERDLRAALVRQGTVEELRQYGLRMGNELRVTPPRAVEVEELVSCVDDLYVRLVNKESQESAEEVAFPEFDIKVKSSRAAEYIRCREKITLPVFDRELTVNYGYQNGVYNLVMAEAWGRQKLASRAPMLALAGRFCKEMGIEGHGPAQMTILARPESGIDLSSFFDKVKQIIEPDKNSIRLIHPGEVDRYADEVIASAHG